jgi:hypothetical protein
LIHRDIDLSLLHRFGRLQIYAPNIRLVCVLVKRTAWVLTACSMAQVNQ